MNFEKAQDRFRLLSKLSESECEIWNTLIEDSIDYVGSMVVKKRLTDADRGRLSSLAGVLAYCRYMTYSVEGGSGFRAGDMTVYADNSTIRNAQALWNNELALNSDLVSESGFVFKRVRT